MNAEMKMLERLFAAEVEGRLPLQSRAKILTKMESDGLVRRMKETVAVDRFGPMVIEGWCLTILGNMTYCMSCEEPK